MIVINNILICMKLLFKWSFHCQFLELLFWFRQISRQKLTEQEMNEAIKGFISSRCFVFLIYDHKFRKTMGTTTTLHGMFVCVCVCSRVHVPWYCLSVWIVPVWDVVRCHVTYDIGQKISVVFFCIWCTLYTTLCTPSQFCSHCSIIQTPFSHISSHFRHFRIENFHRRMDIYTFLWYELT